MSADRQKKSKLAHKEATKQKRRMIEKVLSNSRTNPHCNQASNLNLLVDGWIELDSDPGTFSLLIEDFGCFGAQVDEIYDLEGKFDGPVLGFIFLFKWLNHHHGDNSSRSQKTSHLNCNNNSVDDSRTARHINSQDESQTIPTSDTNTDNDQSDDGNNRWSFVRDDKILSEMFFAKQMISNSCATHALVSILLNCDYDKLDLGPTLTRLKEHTRVMDPENRGYAIGNLPELAKAHNSHASYSSLYNRNRLSSRAARMSYVISGNQRTNLQQQNLHEAYHFVSYIPINNRLYELDGLKNHPIDHGPIGPDEDWTEKFKRVIKKRLNANCNDEEGSFSSDIRYNLMAVVPDRRVGLKIELKRLQRQERYLEEYLSQVTERIYSSSPGEADVPSPPYSPLSNGTLTASESGSANSPKQFDDVVVSDDELANDKYLVVKFEQGESGDKVEQPLPEPLQLTKQLLDVETERLRKEIEKVEASLKEEVDKRKRYKIDDSRRTHNYEPFIMTFLSMLAKQGSLSELIEKDLGIVTNNCTSEGTPTLASPQKRPVGRPPGSGAGRPSGRPPGRPPGRPVGRPVGRPPGISVGRPPGRPPGKKLGRPPGRPPGSSSGKPGRPRKIPLVMNGQKPKPKYRYVPTGRPVGRPRKNPLPEQSN